MAEASSAPATTAPAGLHELDPRWSVLIEAGGFTWHILERPALGTPEVTVLAVHGNPTWSYLWRRLLAQAPPSWRIIAVDQIGMGFSQRPAEQRRLAQRIDDLSALTDALDIESPVVTVAHDWGGPVSLGWALAHRKHVIGCVLTNTAVHQPQGASAPHVIRLARWKPLRTLVTQRTPVFVRGTTQLSALQRHQLSKPIVSGFAAPYRTADRRRAVADFVEDIPLEPEHPSSETLDRIADGVRELDVPVLLAWGTDDPVFSDRYLRDLIDRIPHADVHRYEKAGHLVTEDAPESISDIIRWISNVLTHPKSPTQRSLDSAVPSKRLTVSRDDAETAIVDMKTHRSVTWRLLAERVNDIANGLLDVGVGPGNRTALLIPPGPDLVATVYACWAIDVAVVVADTGLGLTGMRRAIRGSHVDHIVAIRPGLAITRDLDIPGQRILVGSAGSLQRSALAVDATLVEVAARGRANHRENKLTPPEADPIHVVAFTSGSTGPAKGVTYTQSRLSALIDTIRNTYAIDPTHDALIAAFAPWAILGPALGIPTAIPDMDVTDPSTLTMESFVDAADAVDGTIAWMSPTGVRALIESAGHTHRRPTRLRLVMVAGAPTPVETLIALSDVFPNARITTPYGMTEALPLTSVDLSELVLTGPGNGVLVGAPLPDVDIHIAQLDDRGVAADNWSDQRDITGEVIVRAPWVKHSYDRRWAIEARTALNGWHRTGDVGHLDEHGRLWIEGRLEHVITTSQGVVTPVAIEHAAAKVAGVSMVACVGVGPVGRQVVVVVIPGGRRKMAVADVETTIAIREAVRSQCNTDVAAVLCIDELPVDIRHRSKINRMDVARRADLFLQGSGNADD